MGKKLLNFGLNIRPSKICILRLNTVVIYKLKKKQKP